MCVNLVILLIISHGKNGIFLMGPLLEYIHNSSIKDLRYGHALLQSRITYLLANFHDLIFK